MAEYRRESESFTIYHKGLYKCLQKPDRNKYSNHVRDAVLRNCDLGAHGIQQARAGQAVTDGDIREAWRRDM